MDKPSGDYIRLRRDLRGADPKLAAWTMHRAEQEADISGGEYEKLCDTAKRIGYQGSCDGCQHLKFEDRPKTAKVARCFGPVGKWRGRVVEYGRSGRIGKVLRPAWCSPGIKEAAPVERDG